MKAYYRAHFRRDSLLGMTSMKISSLLGASALVSTLCLGVSGAAFAQVATTRPEAPAAAPAEEAELSGGNDIVVTGSRIPRPEFEGTIPGAQITAKDIEARGFTSVLDALNDNPLVGPGASPIGNAGGQPASLGASFVDLLDLGTARTLSLVNGRRFVSGNAGSLFVAANATGGQVDLNVIPTEIVERTDVLTVGGAVAYGSDAIAGVVNIVLKDKYEGISVVGRAGISSRGDLGNQQLSAVAGTNFAGGRGNVVVSFQYNHDDAVLGDAREDFAGNFIAPTFFRNGGVRNPAFTAAIPIDVTGANNGAFLRATDDGIPGNQFGPALSGGSILVSNGGRVFQFTGTLPAGVMASSFNGIVAGNQAGAITSLAGATQVVPGVGISSTVSATSGGNAPSIGGPGLPANTFTRFAPSNLPAGVTAGSVISALAPNFVVPTGTTAAQLNTLAVNLLQANRPTPREFLAANPNTPVNAFLGSLVPQFLDVPNTDAASAAFLPRTAVPLQFNSAGELVSYNTGSFGAGVPATVGGAPGSDFFNPAAYAIVRTAQDRYIGNLIGHFDITDNITFYTENLISKVDNFAPRNLASSNAIANGATETALLVVNLNNPFLTPGQRSTLIASGVTTTGPNANLFVLSRQNQDITGDNAAFVNSKTYRSVNGFRGDLGLFGRKFNFDLSGTYGRSDAKIGTTSIRDIEYTLALDSVLDANNNIVCRVQTPGASTALPLGIVNTVLVREAGPDGVLVERIVPRTVSAAQIAGCQPLNPFGEGRVSAAARNYLTFAAVAENTSEQYFAQGSLATSSLFDLPGGGLGIAFNAEYRKENLDYSPSAEQRLGVSRTAALAATAGQVTSLEGSAEARIPIFGSDFTIPLFQSLTFTPGVRFVKQDGDAPDVRRLNGTLETNQAKGKWNTLYTLGGTWKPIEDILIRGNFTRSIRQPSVVELFLGNQPAFNTPVDPCGNAQIGSGNFPANRRANCEQEVVRLGIAPDRASAANFLTTFVPAGQALQGGFAGSTNLLPEKGKSWTVGGVLTPRFIPGLSLSADYINVEVRNQIIPTTLSNASQFCFDSATFNSTAATLGVNTCSFFDREPTTAAGTPQFNIRNGFASGFINLGALQVRAINAAAQYKFDISSIFGGTDAGTFELKANAYHVIDYISSSAGDFSDSQNSAGSFFRPDWKTQLSGRYETKAFFAQWTWNWVSASGTFNFNTGAFNTIENRDVLRLPAYGLHDATVGVNVNENFRVQLVMRNIFDKRYAGDAGFNNAASAIGLEGQTDVSGRRFQVTARAKF